MPTAGARRQGPVQDGFESRPHVAWLRARARLLPGTLARSPAWVRSALEHTWAPTMALAKHLAPLPAGLWVYLASCESGFVAIGSSPSRYVPGPALVRGRQVRHVAFVAVQDLARDNERPLHVIGHLIDHHLGNGGRDEGPWLSEGGGLHRRWQEAGQRLPGLFALGYGPDEIAQSSVRDYFAQSLALFCRARQQLNVADPQICKWLQSTLWDETFWHAGR